MGLSRIWATEYGIFEVRNGSVTCTELQKPTFHGEKWGCHGSGLQNMVFLKWEMGLSREQNSKNQLVTVRNGVVTGLGYKIWYFWSEKWGFHGCCANIIDLSRWEMGLSRTWATKYGIFEVRNGSVTCTELQKPTFHGEKWGCHGSRLQNMVFLKCVMGLSREQSSKNQLVSERNGVVTGLGYKIWYFWSEKWGCHGCSANIIDLSRWKMGLSRTWATKYGIFEVRNGVVTGVVLIL